MQGICIWIIISVSMKHKIRILYGKCMCVVNKVGRCQLFDISFDDSMGIVSLIALLNNASNEQGLVELSKRKSSDE